MRILITGYKGFIGQNMVNALQDDYDLSLFEWGEGSIDFTNVEACIHLGAISSTTETDVEKIMRQNYDFSKWLLNICNEKNIDFQYSSSASVYGMRNEFTEESPVDPRTPYAWSKYLFERYVKEFEWNVRVQGFRYFNVYGPHEDHKGDQASPYHKFETQAKTNGVIKLFENSENYYRDFIHVNEICNLHKQFLMTVDESGVWNAGTAKVKSFLDIANEISVKYNSMIEIIPMPEKLKSSYQAYTCADMTKTENTLRNSLL